MAIILLHPLNLRSVVNKGDLDVRGIPDFGLGAGSADLLVADLQEEITFFKNPFAVGSYEGEGLGGELEGDGLGLAWFEGDLREVTQALVVRNYRGDEV